MNESFSRNKWKYATIGLAAVLVMVVTTPAAYAADKSHQDIINAINNAVTNLTNLINGKASQTSVNAIQTTDNAIKAKVDSIPVLTNLFKTSIYSEDLDIPNTYPEKVTCTSDKTFNVLVNAGAIVTGGFVKVTLDPTVNNVPSYHFAVSAGNSVSMTFAANAGESITVEALGAGSDDGVAGIVTMQTIQGATASCTPTF
jgi:hypothetical protein